MPSFWKNVLQLIRFFLSSALGLIIIIIKPIINLYKKPLNFVFLIIIIILTMTFIYNTLIQMLGINSFLIV
nr:hypothetical protein [Boldiaceae sp.]